jgi:hypothetical protein
LYSQLLPIFVIERPEHYAGIFPIETGFVLAPGVGFEPTRPARTTG